MEPEKFSVKPQLDGNEIVEDVKLEEPSNEIEERENGHDKEQVEKEEQIMCLVEEERIDFVDEKIQLIDGAVDNSLNISPCEKCENSDNEFKVFQSKNARRKLKQQQKKKQLQDNNCQKRESPSNGNTIVQRNRKKKFYKKRRPHGKHDDNATVHDKMQNVITQIINQYEASQPASKSLPVIDETSSPVVNAWIEKPVKVASTPETSQISTPETSQISTPETSQISTPETSQISSALPTEATSTLSAPSTSRLDASKSKSGLGAIPKSSQHVPVASTSAAADLLDRQHSMENAVETRSFRRRRGRRNISQQETNILQTENWPSLEERHTSKQNNKAKCLSFKNNNVAEAETEIKHSDSDNKKKKKWIPLNISQNHIPTVSTRMHNRQTANQLFPQERAQKRKQKKIFNRQRTNENCFSIHSNVCSNVYCGNIHCLETYGYVGHFNSTSYYEEIYVYEKQVIREQIEYYFSEENLVKDIYLRKQMNQNGFVRLSVIASFPRIERITWDINVVLAAVLESSKLQVLEFPGRIFMIRTVHEPEKWSLQMTVNVAEDATIDDTNMIQAGIADINLTDSTDLLDEASGTSASGTNFTHDMEP